MFGRRNDEEGMAMITAMLVMVVLVSLSLISVQLSAHQGDQSGVDRRRLQSVGAAEAGLNVTVKTLGSTATASLPCPSDPLLSGSLVPAPSTSSFAATVTYYSDWPAVTPMACPMTQANPPKGALVRATALTAGDAQTDRTMETLVRLDPVYGGFNKAVFADSGLDLQNNFEIEGNTGNDGDVYSNGNWTCETSPRIYGSVIVQGSITMENSCRVEQDVWANGSITMDNTSSVGGDAKSSTAGMVLSNWGGGYHINGKATVATTVDRPAEVRLGVTTQTNPAPPYEAFPAVNFIASEWVAKGYTVQYFTGCAAAKTFIENLATTTTKNVVRVTSGCPLVFGNPTVTLGRDLAIVTDGSYTAGKIMEGGAGASTLHVIVPTTTDSGAPQPCTPAPRGNIVLNNQTAFPNLKVLLYSPCTVDMSNLSSFVGQVYGKNVLISNHFTLKFAPVLIPGAAQITGNKVDIAYVRETSG